METASMADASYWQNGKSVLECNRYALENRSSCDVILRLGTSLTPIAAHAYVLSTRSSTFFDMLHGSTGKRHGSIDITDIEPEVFERLLGYLYWENCSFDDSSVPALVMAAKKYDVQDLITKCNGPAEDSNSKSDSWQNGKSVVECNKYALENQIGCDITLCVGPSGEHVKAHKYVLFTRSAVFFAMLCGSMAESCGRIDIPDIEADIFKGFLRYIYWEDVSLDATIVTSMLYVAKKYDVQGLVDECKKYLESEMNEENVCLILEHAHMFEEADLINKSLAFLHKKGPTVLQTKSFIDLCDKCVEKAVGPDALECDEEIVYEALVKWGCKQCERKGLEPSEEHMKTTLGNLLRLIRFPLMDATYFQTKVATKLLLSEDEKTAIQKTEPWYEKQTEAGFSSMPRNNRRKSCYRFTVRGKGYRNRGDKADALQFACSRSIVLQGVNLFGAYRAPGEYTVDISLFQEDTELAHASASVLTEPKDLRFAVNFDRPVLIEPDVPYDIVALLAGPDSYYGTAGKTICAKDDVEIYFTNSSRSQTYTNDDMGQIAGFVYYV